MSNALTISLAMLLFSCGSEPAKEDAKAADTTAAVAATPPPKPEFMPFKVVVIQHKVKNFEKAKAGYFNSDSVRNVYGMTHYILGRDLKDSNTVFVIDKIGDVDKAKAFFAQPKVTESMMKAGVSRAPGYTYAEVVWVNDTPSDVDLHVSVSHHVKDYAAWLKAFEADKPSRTSIGLSEQIIARNLYDSNTVSIMFAVSDMAKVKERMASPEFKKVMSDAGVDGTPTVRWYREMK
jgi:hypothetical protein